MTVKYNEIGVSCVLDWFKQITFVKVVTNTHKSKYLLFS